MGLDESPLGGECDVQQRVGGEQSREPGDQVPGVVRPLHLHPVCCDERSLADCKILMRDGRADSSQLNHKMMLSLWLCIRNCLPWAVVTSPLDLTHRMAMMMSYQMSSCHYD